MKQALLLTLNQCLKMTGKHPGSYRELLALHQIYEALYSYDNQIMILQMQVYQDFFNQATLLRVVRL